MFSPARMRLAGADRAAHHVRPGRRPQPVDRDRHARALRPRAGSIERRWRNPRRIAGRARKLAYLFDRAAADPSWDAAAEPPSRCGTVVIDELVRHAADFDAETRTWLDRITGIGDAPEWRAHLRDHAASACTGRQRSDVRSLVEVNQLPPAGWPDWGRARTGAALEQAWATEVGTARLHGPGCRTKSIRSIPSPIGRSFHHGYTLALGGQLTGSTVCVPDYDGFLPLNDDPDGDEIGALRSTVAHELKHAIQRMYTPWTEGTHGNRARTPPGWRIRCSTRAATTTSTCARARLPVHRRRRSRVGRGRRRIPIRTATGVTFQGEQYGLDHLRRLWEQPARCFRRQSSCSPPTSRASPGGGHVGRRLWRVRGLELRLRGARHAGLRLRERPRLTPPRRRSSWTPIPARSTHHLRGSPGSPPPRTSYPQSTGELPGGTPRIPPSQAHPASTGRSPCSVAIARERSRAFPVPVTSGEGALRSPAWPGRSSSGRRW